MGGATGNAGVFSTVGDVGLYAQALLDRLAGRPSAFPLAPATATSTTTPQEPGHNPDQYHCRERRRCCGGQYYRLQRGQDLRGLGWDIETGAVLATWHRLSGRELRRHGLRPGRRCGSIPGPTPYCDVLSNVIHQPGGPPIVTLSGEIATTAARALDLDDSERVTPT